MSNMLWLFVKFPSATVCVYLPVPDPAGVAVRALAVNGVAVVTVLTGGTHFLAVFAKEALGAKLVAPRPIPASVAGNAASLGHLTGLLALAVPTPRDQPQETRDKCLHFH